MCVARAGEAKTRRIYGQMIIPVTHRAPKTPETRSLTPAEAAAALQRDWLFQAMGRPLAKRMGEEIAWTRELARRITGEQRAVSLSDELAELDALAKRLAKLPGKTAAAGPAALPHWIWFPEGRPAHDAPTESRFFRAALRIPKEANVKRGDLRITCDDAFEVFINGSRIGSGAPMASGLKKLRGVFCDMFSAPDFCRYA